MSESDEDIQIIDEVEQAAVIAANKVEPFDPKDYVAKLTELMKSNDKDAPERLKYLVAQTWARPADSANFTSDAYSMESTISRHHQMSNMSVKNRIAGTQRLMYAPPQALKKSSETEKGTSARKPKKQMPVIDDSIYCTTDQPCATCGGVSQSGNQVLACKRCRDCFHMKCSVPPVSVEEASDPKFQYHCKVCLVSRKVKMDSSRSRSPSPQVLDVKKKILKR